MKAKTPAYAQIIAETILTAPIVALTVWLGWWALLASPLFVAVGRTGYWAAKKESR